MPLVGYFQLSSADVVGKLKQAISGELKNRTDKLSERRKAYVMRQKSGWAKYNAKRKASKPD
jgi:hypothetical protein